MTIPTHLQALATFYDPPNIDEDQLDAFVAQLPAPMPAHQLYDIFGAYVTAHQTIVDVGCRDAKHTMRLVEQLAVHAIGVDPLPSHVFATPIHSHLTVIQGVAEALPLADQSVDAIWCRDVLPHIVNVQQVFAECDRILKPGGYVCVYATVKHPDFTIPQQAYLAEHLYLAPGWEQPARITDAADALHWQLQARHEVGGAWREAWEHDGTHTTSKQLLLLATLRRNQTASLDYLGAAMYHSEYANALWGVFQMLGYTVPTIWVWQKPHARPA